MIWNTENLHLHCILLISRINLVMPVCLFGSVLTHNVIQLNLETQSKLHIKFVLHNTYKNVGWTLLVLEWIAT